MCDRRAGGIGGFEVLLIQFLIERAIGRVAEIVARLDDVREIAAGVVQDLDEVLHRAAELFFKAAGDDLAGFVDGGLTGNEDQVAVAHGRAEGEVRYGCIGSERIFEFRHG